MAKTDSKQSAKKPATKAVQDVAAQLELKPGQSIDLLKALHILTRDGKLNQDSRRKLKQVYHLYQFIEPLLTELSKDDHAVTLADHGLASRTWVLFSTTCISRPWGAAASTVLKPVHPWWKPRRSWRKS